MTKNEKAKEDLNKNYNILAIDGELLIRLEYLRLQYEAENNSDEYRELIRSELIRTIHLLEELSYDCTYSRSIL